MLKLQLPVLVVALVFSGCTMIPKYERPASPVGTQYPGGTQTNASNAANLGWETVFADEHLKQLIRLSLTNNADYQVAVLNVEQSRAQYRITQSSSFPSVSAGGSYTRARASGITSDAWSASLGTTAYEVDLFGRVRSQNRQALARIFHSRIEQRSGESVRRLDITQPNENATHRFFDDRL
jgi:multidrug efflux system outer membrane protein